jgi:hypothetical protein
MGGSHDSDLSRRRPKERYSLQNVSKNPVAVGRSPSTYQHSWASRKSPEIEPIHPKVARHRQFVVSRSSEFDSRRLHHDAAESSSRYPWPRNMSLTTIQHLLPAFAEDLERLVGSPRGPILLPRFGSSPSLQGVPAASTSAHFSQLRRRRPAGSGHSNVLVQLRWRVHRSRRRSGSHRRGGGPRPSSVKQVLDKHKPLNELVKMMHRLVKISSLAK